MLIRLMLHDKNSAYPLSDERKEVETNQALDVRQIS